MTIKELQNELTTALKEKNRVKKTVLADILACAKNIAIEKGCKDDITEEIVTSAIMKSKKVCQEQIDTCPANRPDLLEAFNVCMGYIDEIAPKMMNESEIKAKIVDIIGDFDLQKANKGSLMKLVMPELKGKADGKLISAVIDEFLQKTDK